MGHINEVSSLQAHQEEKTSYARLEARDAVARFPVKSPTKHAKHRGDHYICNEERLVP